MITFGQSKLYAVSETNQRTVLPALLSLGVEDGRSDRLVLHFDRLLHVSTPENPTGETVYIDGRSGGIAVTGPTNFQASELAFELRPFALHYSDRRMGPRFAASQAGGFISKVSFHLASGYLEDVLPAVARSFQIHPERIEVVQVEAGPVSPLEREDEYDFIYWEDLYLTLGQLFPSE